MARAKRVCTPSLTVSWSMGMNRRMERVSASAGLLGVYPVERGLRGSNFPIQVRCLLGRREIGHHDGQFVTLGASCLFGSPAFGPARISAFRFDDSICRIDCPLSNDSGVLRYRLRFDLSARGQQPVQVCTPILVGGDEGRVPADLVRLQASDQSEGRG
jgi:hypothetical protein